MFCDAKLKEPVYALNAASTTACSKVVDFTSIEGCGFDLNALWRWANQYYWIVAITMILVGAFVWALGQKLFKPTIFIVFTLTIFVLVMFLFYALILPISTKDWTVWVIGTVGLLLGLIVGFFMSKLARLGVAALGAWIGFVGGLLIHEAFLFHSSQQWLFWVICVGLAVICGAISFWKYKIILIVSTAFLGSYLLVRGASVFIGGYPNEFTLISKI